MKYIFFIAIIFLTFKSLAQNKPVLYDFADVPQSLMLNPGFEINNKWHAGIPALSGISLTFGIKNFKITDLFANNGININTKLSNLIFSKKSSDHLFINQKLELFYGGYRLKNKNDYLSFGFYEEFNFIGYYPKDYAILLYQGNTDLTRSYDAESIKMRTDLVGVFHIGLNRRISKKLIVGARFKLYSGAVDIKSLRNKGLFYTTSNNNSTGVNNLYTLHLEGFNTSIKSAGLFNGSTIDNNIYNKLIKNLFFGGNFGIGFDFGFTYKRTKRVKYTASVQDLGFINYRNRVKSFSAKGSYTTNGFIIDPSLPNTNYVQNLYDDFNKNIKQKTSEKSYVTFRIPKINASYSYSFGLPHLEDCYQKAVDNPYRNQVGIQLYSIFLPKQPQLATTLFYYKRINKHLQTKLTYTVDSYSASNIGIGLSTRIGHFNLYGSFNNLLSTNIYNSNYNGLQFGMNLIY